MVNLDSIKLKFDKEYLQKYDKNLFTKITTEKYNHKFVREQITKTGVLGLKGLTINSDNFLVEISGKVLKKNYKELININTIESVFDNINASGIVTIDKKSIDNCFTMRCDVTKDLEINDVSDTIHDLQLYYSQDNFIIEKYKFDGVIFKAFRKTYKDRLCVYDKFQEVQKDKELLKVASWKDFQNKLRLENNINSFSQLRKKFQVKGINDTIKYVKLIDILQSKQNPVYDVFCNIYNLKYEQMELNLKTLMNKNEKLYLIEKRIGRQEIIKELGFSPDRIREFLKSKLKGNYSSCLKEYKNLIVSMKSNNNTIELPSKINVIKDMLKD